MARSFDRLLPRKIVTTSKKMAKLILEKLLYQNIRTNVMKFVISGSWMKSKCIVSNLKEKQFRVCKVIYILLRNYNYHSYPFVLCSVRLVIIWGLDTQLDWFSPAEHWFSDDLFTFHSPRKLGYCVLHQYIDLVIKRIWPLVRFPSRFYWSPALPLTSCLWTTAIIYPDCPSDWLNNRVTDRMTAWQSGWLSGLVSPVWNLGSSKCTLFSTTVRL